MLGQAVSRFEEEFGRSPRVAVFAPGRVNLIGEHVDYNDGFVLPFALPFRTIVCGDFAAGGTSRVVSCNISSAESSSSFKINASLSKGEPTWANYVKGTVAQYLNDLPAGAAFEAVVVSDVPIGSGLSSSASLEVATATFLEELYDLKINDGVTKALRCQKAEHTFADMPCGIMDQYCSALGQEGNLLLLDCRTNTFDLVGINSCAAGNTDMPAIVVCNSNVKHSLSGSEYPDRVRQCKEAVEALQKKYPRIKALRDATLEQLDSLDHGEEEEEEEHATNGSSNKKPKKHTTAVPKDGKVTHVGTKTKTAKYSAETGHKIDGKHAVKPKKKVKQKEHELSELGYRRAHHCITEDMRTTAAAKALKFGDFVTAGRLMTQSHLSLQHDYEVSCNELDLLVHAALEVPGVYGSRMTGGGFGGCTVSLVAADQVEELIKHLQQVYPACECYVATPSAGAGTLDLGNAMHVQSRAVSRYGDSDDEGLFTVGDFFHVVKDRPLLSLTVAAAVAAVGLMVFPRRRR